MKVAFVRLKLTSKLLLVAGKRRPATSGYIPALKVTFIRPTLTSKLPWVGERREYPGIR